jgi:hypothetical protein
VTGHWRRHLTGATYGYIKIVDPAVWNLDSHFEPLLVFFCLPYCSYDPKLDKTRELMDRLQRLVPKSDMPAIPGSSRGDCLRKLLVEARRLCALPGSLVPGVLRTTRGVRVFPIRQMVDDDGDKRIVEGDSRRFVSVRAGDHLLTLFQCKVCQARNILGRNLRGDLEKDQELKEMIRRANLDAFWSRESSAVQVRI